MTLAMIVLARLMGVGGVILADAAAHAKTGVGLDSASGAGDLSPASG